MSFLKEIRKKNGLTQEEAAQQLGISARNITRWESGALNPSARSLKKIKEVYRLTLNEFETLIDSLGQASPEGGPHA